MNNNINIAEILKDYPKGTKLYSSLFGNVTLEKVDTNSTVPIKVIDSLNSCCYFTKTGLYYYRVNAEPTLFPSSEMRDWSKLSWKKGDILAHKNGKIECIFVEFVGNDYTSFRGKHCLDCSNENNLKYKNEDIFLTENYFLEIESTAKCYINTIEERLKGKLNPKTLDIEPIKSKFKLKPFDKVLVRDDINERWSINLFSYYDKEDQAFPYVCVSGHYECCIPYEGNEYYLGTNKDYK